MHGYNFWSKNERKTYQGFLFYFVEVSGGKYPSVGFLYYLSFQVSVVNFKG